MRGLQWGAKINPQIYKNLFIDNISFCDFFTMPIKKLINIIPRNESYRRIYDVLSACFNLGIGYLSLNRSIPTLSGGEIANLISSSMSNLLIIIDEISSGLNHADYENVWRNVVELKKRQNTIILVELNHYFLHKCDRRICIDLVGGKNGGYIVEDKLPT
ncbi:hypothetical protein LS73_004725 [Helicobacter muridarum]|uniref:UvrABC system protein A n=1 Tax=Helicobacter muridarum TaxID=216 RepID=A0A099TYA7_9HELI|nr:hypothetical protein [Helicobacter muridarum]TLE00489.1 hypothetical protein LS73_004725 [Helicobacter muridarum]STQ86465.1 excinuclease ABC subunit A [Helicobacter muridarum]